MKTVAFITLGCKVNQYETNSMIQQFIEQGYKILEPEQKADIYVVNTCTVTNISDRKSRQMLRKVKKINKNAIIVACGCYVQVAKEEVKKMQEIDLILGNNEKKQIVEIVENYIKNKNKKEKIENVMDQKEYVELGETSYTEKTRAVIKVQDGCDRFCTYCIIPYARGRVRSRNPKNIISEIEKIAKKGIKEVIITGIHVASYGKDFKEEYKLIDLLEQINKIDRIERIRLGSLEPLLITKEFIERLKKLEKICHHFHLSLQSGCNSTLKRMNRRYTTNQFEEIVCNLRKAYKDVILTTDIIVGFPGETQEEFEETYKFLEKINFYKMHIFKYSPRKGTKAAIMEQQIDATVKEQRSQKLIQLSNKNQNEYNKKYIGKDVEILVEEKKDGIYFGHTQNYILASIESNEQLENKVIKAKCIDSTNEYILTKMVICNKNVTKL